MVRRVLQVSHRPYRSERFLSRRPVGVRQPEENDFVPPSCRQVNYQLFSQVLALLV
jgi:hypothetical protein